MVEADGDPLSLYPLMLTPRFFAGRTALVVGGGTVAERKVQQLLEAGAFLTVIAPDLTPTLQELAASNKLEWLARVFQAGDVLNRPQALLVLAATNLSAVNEAVAAEARAAGRIVNRADDTAQSEFITPATARSGDITLAVATATFVRIEGATATFEADSSPTFTAYLRQKLALSFGAEYGELLALMRKLSQHTRTFLPMAKRQVWWRLVLKSPALELLQQGHPAEAEALIQAMLEQV